MRDGKRGIEMLPISRDSYFGPYIQLQLVRLYLQVGEPEQALDRWSRARGPFYLSPGWLRIDPSRSLVEEPASSWGNRTLVRITTMRRGTYSRLDIVGCPEVHGVATEAFCSLAAAQSPGVGYEGNP